MNPVLLPAVPEGVVTVTDTAAPVGRCEGLLAVMEVVDTTTTVTAALAPKWTDVAPVKFLPVMVTAVPPVMGPDVGVTVVTTGSVVPPLPVE